MPPSTTGTVVLCYSAPGWVRTEHGGSDATLSTEESIPLLVDMIEANPGKTGLIYVDCVDKPLSW